jgi:hypothetical protein
MIAHASAPVKRVGLFRRDLVAQDRSIERSARRAVRSHLAGPQAARAGHP